MILSTVAVILASNYYLGGPKDDSPPKQIEVVQAPANFEFGSDQIGSAETELEQGFGFSKAYPGQEACC